MRSIFLLLMISGVIGLVVYFGVFKNENLNNNGFQSVGEISLQGNVSNSLMQDITSLSSNKSSQLKSSSKKSQIAKSTKMTAIIAPIINATSTESVKIETSISSTSAIIESPVASTTELKSIKTESESASVELVTSTAPAITISSGRIVISEILVGIDGNADYEFIELYNPNTFAIDLTGWSIKKRSSSGNESTLISNSTKYGNFKDKKIQPGKYLLLSQKDGYNGVIKADILYSNSLAYKNNAIVLYNPDGKAVEDIGWDEITNGQSLERVSWSSGEFKIQSTPNPQNSSY